MSDEFELLMQKIRRDTASGLTAKAKSKMRTEDTGGAAETMPAADPIAPIDPYNPAGFDLAAIIKDATKG